MRKILSLVFFLLFITFITAQESLKWVSKSTHELVLKGKECYESNNDNCEQWYKQAIEQAKQDKMCLTCTELYLAQYLFKKGQYDSSLLYFNRVINSNEKLSKAQKEEIHMVAYNTKGVIEGLKGDMEASIKSYFKASELAENAGNDERAASIKFNVGIIYFHQSNYKEALKLFKEVYAKVLRIKSEKLYPVVTGNIAGVFYAEQKLDSALIWARHSLKISKKQNDLSYINYAYYVLAKTFNELHHKDSAMYYAKLGVETSRKDKLPDRLTENLSALAEIQLKDKDYKNALRNFEEATSISENEIGILTSKVVLFRDLGQAYYEMEDYKKSAYYFNEFLEVNDSIASIEQQSLIHDLNTKYETEKKEKQIAEQDLKIQKQTTNFWIAILGGLLLAFILGGIYYFNRKSNQNKLIQLQSEKENAILNSFIQGEERERNRISHELHDGVAAMIGAAKMSIESIPHLSPEKQNEQLVRIKTILESTHADVRHIAHNLLPTVLEKEGLIKATEHFAHELNATKLIQISVKDHDSNAHELKPQLQLMLFRVIQELINNTIKHSQAKVAQIEFFRNENGLQIEVSDDGVGFDGEIKDGNQGLYSISQRLKSIGGNFKFIKKSDRGMKAVAELKV